MTISGGSNGGKRGAGEVEPPEGGKDESAYKIK